MLYALSCGGPTALGEMSFDEQQLRIENARLKEEVNHHPHKACLFFLQRYPILETVLNEDGLLNEDSNLGLLRFA